MGTCVKTGVILLVKWSANWTQDPRIIYGDLHLVGSCAIIYYPSQQDAWQVKKRNYHGVLTVGPDAVDFQRDTMPFHIWAVPISWIRMRTDTLHHIDDDKWRKAGGETYT